MSNSFKTEEEQKLYEKLDKEFQDYIKRYRDANPHEILYSSNCNHEWDSYPNDSKFLVCLTCQAIKEKQ